MVNCNGLDGVIVGPYDLSASLGFPGNYNKEIVKNLDIIEKN